ncbi:MAG: ferredoxin [Selenomonadaceae bacterium]
MLVDNVRVIIENGELSEEEVQYYINKIKRHSKRHVLRQITFFLADDYMDIRYAFNLIPFERIRRIALNHNSKKRKVNVS